MKFLKRTAALVGVTAILAGGGMAAALPANAAPAGMLGCQIVDTAAKDGRSITLWNCNGEFHGQLNNASPGDLAYMRNGSLTAGGAYVPAGSSTVNTGPVSGSGWQACVAVHDRPGQDWCGARS